MNMFKKFFTIFETRLVPPRLSLWRTIYFNFRTQPFLVAIKFPIYIYGRVHFPMLAGTVQINGPIYRGMIKIGKQDPFCATTGQGFVAVSPNAKLIFNGPCHISTNVCIRLLSGELILGKYLLFGSFIKVILNGKQIGIGDYTRMAFQTVIVNSSFHSVVDMETLAIKPHIRDIVIGSKCWIGNNSTISGGAMLKDGTIVGAGSYVNKDFTKHEEEHQMIAGRPAKLLKSGFLRIWSPELEMKIIKWFESHPEENSYRLNSLDEDDINEIEKEYK